MHNRIKDFISKLHNDEAGDVPVGTMLIIALIVIPLLFLLISFKDNIVEFFTGEAQDVLAEGENSDTQRPEL